MTTGKRKFREFCWINVMTPKLEDATKFFQQVLGWQSGEGLPGGHVIHVDGLPAGALMDLAVCPPGIPPVIGVMIKVENAEATVARVIALGGSAEPVMDVGGNGRMASCTDPTGAIFNIWQPLTKDGAECDPCVPGAPTWFELHSTDPEKAAQFYTELFGWTAAAEPMGPGMTYTTLHLDGAPIAGAMRAMPDPQGNVQPSHWGTYFTVLDADATVKLTKQLGGELCFGPHDIPKVGRFALVKSPQGVSFLLLQHAATN